MQGGRVVEETVDDRSFRKALGCFASGVTVVTTLDEAGNPAGLTVSSFSSVSLDPPLVLICLGKKTKDLEHYSKGYFAVHVLGERQRELSIRFAGGGAKNKWEGLSFKSGLGGTPLLSGGLATIECAVESAIESGDHVILVGRVERVSAQPSGQPLLYFKGGYFKLGAPE
ncbi:MAG: flavin reductase [Alphaproteobacteria bacterium RIFOXYD12_FULL_60_8]|nr:MAG: flavin reductase [Alphaproteobacteria bacterium RIFOXYD12_FULL_60_8]